MHETRGFQRGHQASSPDDDERIFRKYDEDGSGSIDVRELDQAMNDLGINNDATQTRSVMSWYDKDNSGGLQLVEYRALMQETRNFQRGQQASSPDDDERIFRKYDEDGSGDIDVRELDQALNALGIKNDAAQTGSVMGWYDKDNSGGLQLLEYRALMHETRSFQQRR